MAYEIGLDEPIDVAIRRVGSELVIDALQRLRSIDAPETEPTIAVHESRKRCKEIRGLVRLVRPAIGDAYADANATFRDAARTLSDYRDAHALLGTFDDLVACTADRLPSGGLGPIRHELVRRARSSTAALQGDSPVIGEAIDLFESGLALIDEWHVEGEEWHAIAGGIAKTYARGDAALATAVEEPTPDHFHQLRKRAKYTWYHLQLIEAAAPGVLSPLASRFHDLSDALGDAHDLAVLTDQITDDPDPFGGPEVVERATLFVDESRRDLEQRAVGTAHRLYAESAERFVDRLGTYWSIAADSGAEAATGELADIFEVAADLGHLTMADLRRHAAAAGVVGRWSMRRDELVAAVRAEGVTSADRG